MSEGPAAERLVSRSEQGNSAPSDAQQSAMQRLRHRAGRHIDWPLAAVLAVQAGFSLSLVWSNYAYFDEADHILEGQRVWSGLVHGTPVRPYGEAGARQIYPLIGALANSVGGLAAARILSLCFMLVASVLLYQTGVRLFGRTAALAGVALWAVSEPVLRLAFATWDPLACLLVIASLRLSVQAGAGRHKTALVAFSALALALAGVTALPFLIYIPVVIAVTLLAWLSQMRVRLAIWWTLLLTICSAALVLALLTVLQLWPNVVHLAAYRPAITHFGFWGTASGRAQVARLAWAWDGLIFVVACAGAVAAIASERRKVHGILVAALAAAALPVPLYQMHIASAIGLDKQMSAGTGMAALAAGYLVGRLRPEFWRRPVAWLAAGVIMLYPAVSGLWYARETFRSWPDSAPLIATVKPLATASRPVLMSTAASTVAEFYLGGRPEHWIGYGPGLPIGPKLAAIRRGAYSGVVLAFELSALASPSMSKYIIAGPALDRRVLELLHASRFVAVLSGSTDYKLRTVIPYRTTDASDPTGAWLVWERVR
jgi:hypothetical protein